VRRVDKKPKRRLRGRRNWCSRSLSRALEEFGTYIDNNAGAIVSYGERRRRGERISTGFVESTINQLIAKRFVKKQKMRWTPRGAHLLLQVRVHFLNDELGTTFRRWHPKLGSDRRLSWRRSTPKKWILSRASDRRDIRDFGMFHA
jgi:hypothetical protein